MLFVSRDKQTTTTTKKLNKAGKLFLSHCFSYMNGQNTYSSTCSFIDLFTFGVMWKSSNNRPRFDFRNPRENNYRVFESFLLRWILNVLTEECNLMKFMFLTLNYTDPVVFISFIRFRFCHLHLNSVFQNSIFSLHNFSLLTNAHI